MTLLAAGALASIARADGDPGSDLLVNDSLGTLDADIGTYALGG